MKSILLSLGLFAGAAAAQTVSPVDKDTTEKFRLASISGDYAALGPLLSDKIRVSVSQQMGPNGPNREIAEGKGRAEALKQLAAAIAVTGKPADAECGAPDGVSVFCQYRFDQPGRGMQSMIMFDGKKIGALMIKYGGAAIQ